MAFKWLKREPEVISGALEEHHEEVQSQSEAVAPIKPSEKFAPPTHSYLEYQVPNPSPRLEYKAPFALTALAERVARLEERILFPPTRIPKQASEDANILRQLDTLSREVAKLTSFVNEIKNRGRI